MKTGVSMFSFTEDTDLKHLFPPIKQAGYNGVELVLSESGYLNQNISEREILEIKKMTQDMGLEVSNVGVQSLQKNNSVSNDSSIQQKAEDIIERQVGCAALMGANTVLVVPGYVGCDFVSKPEQICYGVTYERCIKAFRSLTPLAERAGVSIGIENVWNRFPLSPLEMKRLVQDTGSPAMGVYFDMDNIMYVGYPENRIGIPGSPVRKIHLSNCRTDQAGLGAFTDLLVGDVDSIEVTEVPRAVGYNDYPTLKILPSHK